MMLTVPGGRSAWTTDVGEQHRREGRRGRGLEDDRVAGGQGRGDLPGEHQQREVPRDDLRGHAERLRHAAGERVVELVRPARVVPEMVGGERHVDVAALLDRLARVHRFEDGELARALLEDPRDAEQVLGALPARQLAPGPALGAAGGADGLVDIDRAGARDLGQRLLGRRVDRDERVTAGGRHGPPVDEQAVALLERDDVARLGGRRVLPWDRLPVARSPSCSGAGREREPRSCCCARPCSALCHRLRDAPSAVVGRHGVHPLAVADVDVVVVAGMPAR